jgi:MFS family permease
VHEKAEAMAEDKAVTFDLGTILNGFFGVSSSAVPYFMVIFAAGNFLGPLLLGRFFDTVGRIPMISGTYLVSAAFVVVLGLMVRSGSLTRWSFEALLVGTFFFASAGASSAYLTVSEIFPVEIRAEAIAVFFAMAQAVGALGPAFYGALIGNGSNRAGLTIGYLIGGGIMILGGLIEVLYGINAERKALESVARPLTQVSS